MATESRMGPYKAMMPEFRSSSELQEDKKGKFSYIGQPTSLMQEFMKDNEDRLPRDRAELNSYLKYKYPGGPQFKESQFQNAIASVKYGTEVKDSRIRAALEKENKSTIRSLKKDANKRYAEVQKRVRKEAADYVKSLTSTDVMQEPPQFAQTFNALAPQAQRNYIKSLANKRVINKALVEDRPWNDIQEQITDAKKGISSPQRPQKERPAGGGSIVVTGDPVGEGDAKKGTILTTKGAYGEAKQYKFEPGDDGNFRSFRYQTDPRTGQRFWKEGKPISPAEAYKISGGKAGVKDVPGDTEEDVSADDLRTIRPERIPLGGEFDDLRPEDDFMDADPYGRGMMPWAPPDEGPWVRRPIEAEGYGLAPDGYYEEEDLEEYEWPY